MTLELNMTLAEALVERKGLKERLDNLKGRLAANARVQEGDTPTEAPADLMEQVRRGYRRPGTPDRGHQPHQPGCPAAGRGGLEPDGGHCPP